MNKIQIFATAVAIFVCTSSYAQFSNTGSGSSLYSAQSSRNSYSTAGGAARGYRGFVEVGYTIGVGDHEIDRMAVSTSHGYQFNPHLFVGGGISYNYFKHPEAWSLPIFANVRGILLDHKISPYADLKVGYSVSGDIKGFYMNPSIGCRFSFSDRFALLSSVGYEMQYAEIYTFYWSYYSYSANKGQENLGGVTFKIGFEF